MSYATSRSAVLAALLLEMEWIRVGWGLEELSTSLLIVSETHKVLKTYSLKFLFEIETCMKYST